MRGESGGRGRASKEEEERERERDITKVYKREVNNNRDRS